MTKLLTSFIHGFFSVFKSFFQPFDLKKNYEILELEFFKASVGKIFIQAENNFYIHKYFITSAFAVSSFVWYWETSRFLSIRFRSCIISICFWCSSDWISIWDRIISNSSSNLETVIFKIFKMQKKKFEKGIVSEFYINWLLILFMTNSFLFIFAQDAFNFWMEKTTGKF